MRRTSRLWRRLGLTQPLVRVWTESDSTFTMNDHDLTSITINRGSANSVFGEQEHTLEVNSIVPRGVRTGHPVHVDLTASGAQRLVNLIGGTREWIDKRFYGRIGRQTIDDGGGISDPSKWHTTVYASKWQSQLANSDRLGNQIHGEPVMYLFNHFMRPAYSDMPYLPDPEFPSQDSHYGYMSNDYELGTAKIPYREFSSKYFEAPGYYVQNMRDGHDRVLTIQYRWSVANARLETQVPLTRAHALAPAQWDQPNENQARNHRVIYRTSSEGLKSAITGPAVDDVRVTVEEHDVSYMRWVSEYQPQQMNYAHYGAERNDSGYRLPTVDIDLLRLIDSPNHSDRLQARQLLRLEMGDPIQLSDDWHPYLRGIHFATGITEKITPDGWDMTLSLMPSIGVVGHWTPAVAAQVWDSARYPWNDETRRWDEA